MNVEPFFAKESNLYAMDAKEFLSSITTDLWGDIIGETIMDIGCANGNSTKLLLHNFPDVKRIIVIDNIPSLIALDRHLNPNHKVEYHVASIESKSSLKRWKGKISKAVSICCFSFVANQKSAFRNLYRLLQPGGQAAVLFHLTSSCFNVCNDLMQNSNWGIFFKDISGVVPESHNKQLGASHYLKLFEEIGFVVHHCEEKNKTYTYSSDEECKEYITVCPLIDTFPVRIKNELKDYLFHTFLKYSPRNSDGKPCLHYKTLSVILLKPE